MNSATEANDAKASSDTSMSRDEVKAQREAKKAAKAAKKGKVICEAFGGADVKKVNTQKPVQVQTYQPKTQETLPAAAVASPGSENDSPTYGSAKSKAQLKAERRALQESQRLAKANLKPQERPGGEIKSAEKVRLNKAPTSRIIIADTIVQAEKDNKDQQELHKHESTSNTSPNNDKQFDQIGILNVSKISSIFAPNDSRIHSLFYWGSDTQSMNEDIDERKVMDLDLMFRELGMMYSNNVIRGSNERTIALLTVVKKFVKQYRTPKGKGFKHDLSSRIKGCLDKLKLYQPFAVGMTNAVDGLNGAIRRLDEGLSDEEYRDLLQDWCDRFIEEKIEKAAEAIAKQGVKKIEDGDTILLFSLTDLIYHVLKRAGEKGKKFQLVLAITNSDTHLQDYKQFKDTLGPEVFRNVRISCINVSSIMTFISSIDKVFFGGHALFTTGGVMARAGSSIIALCAIQQNIPTLFFCETYKFCDKPPTDAFYQDVFLENKICRTSVSDPDLELGEFNESAFNGCEQNEEIPTAVVRYDVTPVKLVTCVITDIDMLPSSNVSVVLRVQETRQFMRK